MKRLVNKIFKSETKFPAGHFHSPLIDKAILSEDQLFELKSTFPGVDINVDGQLDFLKKLSLHYSNIDFPHQSAPDRRYYFDNPYFSYSDAIIYAAIIREVLPKAIVEVGSGYSTACALDTLTDLTHQCQLTCIDPNPDRLESLLTPAETSRVHIQAVKVQESSVGALVQKMLSGDILFIDSSHISKAGSDLNYLLHEILPVVPRGVYVHFHDVFHSFEYPREWLEEGVELNEQYILRSFLQFNEAFEVMLLSDYMEKHHRAWYEAHMPDCLRPHERHYATRELIPHINGQSLWIRRK